MATAGICAASNLDRQTEPAENNRMSSRTTEEIRQVKDDLFFATLRDTGRPSTAAEVSGMDRSNLYKRRKADPAFAERWDAALDLYADTLEAEAHRRAVLGTEKGVWHQGIEVGKERQFSDSLLLAMLKAKRRREYGDTSKLELTGADGGPVQVEESPIVAARKIAFALALGLRAAEATPPTEPATDGSDLA